ncbi:DNA-methyltransferase [Natribacillus halophilus]|uniref:Methyltransferase n=1 Tax=Natribacillus halophilus TaxID=549003 RepID=A0A1G8M6X5_9BACI|nr:site-specific DNA-methyltransferase [Natribacillus halophilus]SDI63709.1 site-specific DNA-methyltransferase (adenine-specific) [Natribacillus halophilus]
MKFEPTISLYNRDCIETLLNLESNSIDFILTDPPYNLANFMKKRQTNLKRMRENFFGDAGWDESQSDDWIEFMKKFFSESNRVLKKEGTLIVFMSLIRVESVVKIAELHSFYYKTTGIWHKTNPMPRNMNLHFINSTEGWIYFINSGRTGTYNNDGKAIHDFIETSAATKKEKKHISHPTQKPLALMEHFIRLMSNQNDTILDTFMGSGTTGVAAKKLGRNFIGCEIEKNYYEAAKKRIDEQASDDNIIEITNLIGE